MGTDDIKAICDVTGIEDVWRSVSQLRAAGRRKDRATSVPGRGPARTAAVSQGTCTSSATWIQARCHYRLNESDQEEIIERVSNQLSNDRGAHRDTSVDVRGQQPTGR